MSNHTQNSNSSLSNFNNQISSNSMFDNHPSSNSMSDNHSSSNSVSDNNFSSNSVSISSNSKQIDWFIVNSFIVHNFRDFFFSELIPTTISHTNENFLTGQQFSVEQQKFITLFLPCIQSIVSPSIQVLGDLIQQSLKKLDFVSFQIGEIEKKIKIIEENTKKYPVNISTDPTINKRPWQVIDIKIKY